MAVVSWCSGFPFFLEKKMLNKFPLAALRSPLRSATLAIAAVAIVGLALPGCTTTPPSHTEEGHADLREINANVDLALAKLNDTVPSSRELVRRAKGIVVFPSILQAGFVVGGEYGKGVLRVGNVSEEYLRLTAGSVGWQIGAQSKAVVLLFMTQDALEKFRHSNGWEVGADATVAVATIGANGDIDTITAQKPIIGFVTTNAGLMAGVTLQGAKIDVLVPKHS
jgi:lipid-binding SYLF domain-containing protein